MLSSSERFKPSGRRFVDWYRNAVLPLWIETGYDDVHGGFYEALNFDGAPAADLDRRVRVQSRQIYVMSRIATLGWREDAAELAAKGFSYFQDRCCPEGGARGCVHRLSPRGDVIDPLRDLYDQAFVLLSCASLHELTGDKEPLMLADRTIAFMDAELKSPNGGWTENDQNGQPRRQNPHMHLFEAFMALFSATNQERYLAYADQVFSLFQKNFYDAGETVLREFFTENWDYAPAPHDAEIEPGHMMEWVYLLRVYEQLRRVDVSQYCCAFYQRAQEIGAAPGSPFLVDKLQLGAAPSGNRRLWPQTEYVKAACLNAAASDANESNAGALDDAAQIIEECFKSYFNEPVSGLWCDQFDENGARIAPNAPASILYHLLDAVIAVDRVLEARR